MVDLRKFEFNSKFKTDNVIWTYETTSAITNTTWGTASFNGSVANPFSFKPLVFGIYSLDNGASWSDLTLPQTPDYGYGEVISNSSTISWSWSRNYTVSASTAKIRLFAFMPSNVDVSVNASTPLSKFYINTKFGYDNLIASGFVTVPNNSANYTLYTHNLGYYPKVLLWAERGNDIMRFQDNVNVYNTATSPVTQTFQFASLTTTALTFTNSYTSGGVSIGIHYRIYGGQNG